MNSVYSLPSSGQSAAAESTRHKEGNALMATLQEITDRIKGAVGDDSGLGKSLKFDLKDTGVIHIDGGSVTNEDAPADLTMTMSMDDLLAIGAGTLDPTMAVMTGKLKLSDMGTAMALQSKMAALFAKMR